MDQRQVAEQGPRLPTCPTLPGGRTFSPNEKYAALMETAGFLPLRLIAEDYLELLPNRWQAVNSYGVKVNHRIYNLDDLRRTKSGIVQRKNRWALRHAPYGVRLSGSATTAPDSGSSSPGGCCPPLPPPSASWPGGHTIRDLREQGEQVTEDAIAEAAVTCSVEPPAAPRKRGSGQTGPRPPQPAPRPQGRRPHSGHQPALMATARTPAVSAGRARGPGRDRRGGRGR
ncbi:hypothetical protein GCM10010245_86580 [Streptomyces spectabilis]|nr:hypothetical protein GCM10010245_86580 [Streptomyces spectabilis]